MGPARDLRLHEVRPNRILLVTHEFPPVSGGIGTHCFEMAKHWSSVADVTAATIADDVPRRQEDLPFGLVQLSCPRGQGRRVLALARQLRGLLTTVSPDLVYSGHWRATGLALRIAMAGLGRKPHYVQAIHGSEVLYLLQNDAPRGHRRLFHWTTDSARRLVALGGYQGELLVRLGVERSRIFVSPEGVDVDRFERVDPPTVGAIRDRHGLVGRFALLTVGRLVERKGHDTVIRALPRVVHDLPEVVYLIVGSGPYESHLRSLARELELDDRVVFCGHVPEGELVAYYHACDAFAMISRELADDTEGFGIVFMEAAACGKPTIGGRAGGVPDAIVDGETGLLVEPTAVEHVAEAIVRIGRNPSLARHLGEAGRKRVRESYRYEDIAAAILDGISSANAAVPARAGSTPREESRDDVGSSAERLR
jgi:phosphatidylinositol alpha-1,6-mannosyltransferase